MMLCMCLCLLESCLLSPEAQLLEKLKVCLERYVPGRVRGLEFRLMLSNTLNLSLFPLFWLQRNKTVSGETAALLCGVYTLDSLISRILSLIVFVLRPPRVLFWTWNLVLLFWNQIWILDSVTLALAVALWNQFHDKSCA